MDLIHDPDNRSWISPPINLSAYFTEYANEVGDCSVSGSRLKKKVVGSMIGLDTNDSKFPSLYGRLEEACDLKHLLPEGEEHVEESINLERNVPRLANVYEMAPIPEDAAQTLKTLACQKEFLSMDKKSKVPNYRRTQSLRSQDKSWFSCRSDPPTKLNHNLVNKEILAVVKIYRPMKHEVDNPVKVVNLKYCQEIYLLGSNKLTELRDLIKCPLDFAVDKDMSNDPHDSKPRKFGREKYKSGFLFIDNCFYNDTRWPECIDYSKTIRDWASQPGRHIGPFRTEKMEDVSIKDLKVRVGYPYVYVHQGHHEHLFSFTDIRLVSDEDPQKIGAYPYERSFGSRHGKHCMACSIFLAKWVTSDNERVPEDPFYFCDNCFHDFNYDKNGDKIGDFKATRYFDINTL